MTHASLLTIGFVLALCSGSGGAPLAQTHGSLTTSTHGVQGGVDSHARGEKPLPVTPATTSGQLAATASVSINFDDVSAPCLFLETNALGTQYASQGVAFIGRGANNGGTIVNQCGNWNVTGHSSPNFLAFNHQGQLMNGGLPRAPGFIRFLTPMSHVEMKVGSGISTAVVYIASVNSSGSVIDSEFVTPSSALQTVALDGNGIVGVWIVATQVPYAFVIDDLVAN